METKMGNEFIGVVLTLAVCAIILILTVLLIEKIIRYKKNKNVYLRYPELKVFEDYMLELKSRIEDESSWHFLKMVWKDIENVYCNYNGKVPDDVLKSELINIRKQYASRRNELAPKITTE